MTQEVSADLHASSVVLSLVLAVGMGGLIWPAAPYTSDVQEWRERYERDLLGPDGPFTLVARLLPKVGTSSLGRDQTNDLIVPVEETRRGLGKSIGPEGRAPL